jgi:insulysin
LRGLHLPPPNFLIPKNLELKKVEPAAEPRLIRNDDGVRIWYKPDLQAPKANVFIHCRNALSSNTLKSRSEAILYAAIVEDTLKEFLYDAELTKLECELTDNSTGILIEASGYNEMLPDLLEDVLNTMRDFEIKPGRFEVVKERESKKYGNAATSKSWFQAAWFMTWILGENQYRHEQIFAELQGLTAADVEGFCTNLLGQMQIEIFVHGNMYKTDALKLGDIAESTLRPLPKTQWPMARALSFSPGTRFVYQRTLPISVPLDNCIECFLYLGYRFDGPTRAKTFLLDQIIHEPTFHQLRTKEQLGYVVLTRVHDSDTIIGYRIAIQGEGAPGHMEDRIDSFLTGFAEVVEMMEKSELETHKKSAVEKLIKKPKNAKEESECLWSHIYGGYVDFKLGMFFFLRRTSPADVS